MRKKIETELPETISEEKMGQMIHLCFGYLMWKLRNVSPLSHDELQLASSINSCTSWRLEHSKNYSVKKLMEAMYYLFGSIKCSFEIRRLCKEIESCLYSGKCLVLIEVDSSELHKFDSEKVIFIQNSGDSAELGGRAKREQDRLRIIQKLGSKKWKKKQNKANIPQKKNTKKE